jgi:uncharacterized protein (TIGR03663 family)
LLPRKQGAQRLHSSGKHDYLHLLRIGFADAQQQKENAMAVYQRDHTDTFAGALDRPIEIGRLRLDIVAFVTIVALSIIAHLYALDRMALHHDESIHAWLSWRFYEGRGTFTCAGGRVANTYCYDPVYHGPSLYVLTLVSYFLFGDGDAQARYPQAIAGIGMVASAWMLRPYLGTRGALLAAVLLGFTPTLLYYTRFARHDGLMVLWSLWIVIGFFRYIDTGRPRYLYLLGAAIALAVATHELYYILGFIFGWFLIIRVLYENLPRRQVVIGLGAIVGLALLVELSIITGLWYGRITSSLRADGLALLFIATAGSGLLAARVWDQHPIVTPRLVALWREQRTTLWIALAIMGGLYAVLYSTFFADPRGVVDGLYQGLAYWLGSQQEFKRGDQPWYYYLILMPLYEPLAFFGAFGATIYLFTRRRTTDDTDAEAPVAEAADAGDGVEEDSAKTRVVDAPAAPLSVVNLFPLFLAFWFVGALVIFSWAGEKMPWLNSHIALPANLLLAWTLSQVIGALQRDNGSPAPPRVALLIPILLTLMIVAVGVALWRFSIDATDLQGQSSRLQGLIPLLIAGALLYSLLTIAQRTGRRAALALSALTVAALVGCYTIRATWMVVYEHPDTPREPLIYTQSAPDVPLIVREIRELAIAQTRNVRNPSDPAGGLTMPIIMDNGDPAADGEGSLAWPYQWYLRDFQRIEIRDAAFFREAGPESFVVDPPEVGGDRLPAPVVLVSRNHVNEAALEAEYVRRYDAKLNWWFPEGNKCDPQSDGYKRFYFAYPGGVNDAARVCPGIDTAALPSFLGPLLWPLDGAHWEHTGRYLLYRELPPGLTLDGREMQVWIRRDLAGGSGSTAARPAADAPLTLVVEQSIGAFGSGPGELNEPRGIAVDAAGNIYIADTMNHRIQVFDAAGEPRLTIGSFGAEPGQFNEPRGIAVDAAGNIYVADTWNARIVKLDPQGAVLATWGEGREDFGGGRRASPTDGTAAGNAADPLGLFGPRAIAVDAQGNVYIADTGNKRVVVTDTNGNYQYQWGYAGAAPGAFNEPIGIAVDLQGRVYVGDTWNGRVQVFAPGADGAIAPTPIVAWRVAGWADQTYDDPFIAAGPDGQIFAGIPAENTIAYADLSGQELLRWTGVSSDGAPLILPSGLAVGPDGAIYAVDRGNGRILRFRIPLPGIAP